MQVFGLPRHVIRSAGASSRLLAAKTPSIEAARRRDAVARWRRAIGDGLGTEQAAKAVGVARATLYRWEKQPEPKSRRPYGRRKPTWAPSLAQAVEALRADNPMWGKRKIAALLRLEGLAASVSTVGRILRKLMDRGVVVPVPTLRRNPTSRRIRLTQNQRYARRLPKGLKPIRPGEIVHPVAKWTTGHVATKATATSAAALLDKLIRDAPFTIEGIQVDGGSEFKAAFEQACKDKGLTLYVLPPKRPQLNGAVERNRGAWRYEFYASFDLPHRIDKLQPLVDAFAHRFNHHRPHQALGDLTPAAYLRTISGGEPASHKT